MAVAFNSVANVTPGTGSSFNFNITVPSSNPVLLVGIGLSSTTATVSSVTWSLGSGTPVEVKTVRLGSSFGSTWAIPAPAVGAGTVTVNLDTSVPYQGAAETFTGAHQTTPCPIADATSGTGSEVSQIVVTPANLTSNDVSFGIGVHTVAEDPSGITQNDRFKNNTTAVNFQIGDSSGTSALAAHWTTGGAGANEVAIGVRIVPVGSGPIVQLVSLSSRAILSSYHSGPQSVAGNIVGQSSLTGGMAGGGGFAAPDIADVDFQDGTVGVFNDEYGPPDITIIDDPTGAGFGKVCRMTYHVEGAGNQDSNTSIDYNNSAQNSPDNYTGKTDVYHRIYVYFVDPGTQHGQVVELIPSGMQRKLIYINPGEGPDYWTGTIQRWLDGATGTMDNGVLGPRSVTKASQPGFEEIEVSGAIDVLLNTWYYFEYRVKLETPGQSNGRIQIWGGIKGAADLENALLWDLQNVNIRHGYNTNTYKSCRIGQQLDAFTNGIYIVDDIRYLKNVAISTQRIGP